MVPTYISRRPKRAIAAIALLLLLDFLWLSSTKPMYQALVARVQKNPMEVSWVPAVVAYALMIVGLICIVLPTAEEALVRDGYVGAFRIAALYGLTVYGIFNATNAAIFKDYSGRAAVIDTLWGTTVYSLVTLAVLRFV